MSFPVTLCVLLLGLQGAIQASEPVVAVKVVVEGLRPSVGQLKVGLFGKEGFPRDDKRVLYGVSAPIAGTNQTVLIKGVPPGRYAILVHHDENANGTMDLDLLGRPKEGYGVSNNARHVLRPPLYEEAAVLIGNGEASFLVKMRY